jgi:hypothetical protein
VTRDSATGPWAVESESGVKVLNPSPDVTDALADLLAGGVSSSESPDSESPIVSLDVDPASSVHACHVQCDADIPRSFQQAMKSPLAAAWKDACDDEISRMNVLHVFGLVAFATREECHSFSVGICHQTRCRWQFHSL